MQGQLKLLFSYGGGGGGGGGNDVLFHASWSSGYITVALAKVIDFPGGLYNYILC